jgi:hypothetical protein
MVSVLCDALDSAVIALCDAASVLCDPVGPERERGSMRWLRCDAVTVLREAVSTLCVAVAMFCDVINMLPHAVTTLCAVVAVWHDFVTVLCNVVIVLCSTLNVLLLLTGADERRRIRCLLSAVCHLPSAVV